MTEFFPIETSIVQKLAACWCGIMICFSSFAQSPVTNNYHGGPAPRQLKVERSFIYIPAKEWMYAHHPHITFFKGQFIASWSNGMTDEDAPGQRVVYATSKDFFTWSAPQVLALPGAYNDTMANVLTAAGFHKYADTLVAYYGEYSPKRTHTKLWAKHSTDGVQWSQPIDMYVPVNPNLGPQTLTSGRLITCGNFTFAYTDDLSGLKNWKISSIYPDSLYKEDNPATFYRPAEKLGLPPLCETSFFQTDDQVIHAFFRVTGKGWKGRLWATESKDDGLSWSFPLETSFTDNDSKFHFGRLPGKDFYYVGIPDTLHHYERKPLVLAISKDGKNFNRQYIIASSLYQLKKEGLWKGGQYGYPHSMIHDGSMYVIVSRQKEAVEVIRFKLAQL